MPGSGSRRDGRGSPSVFERQARTIGRKGPLLVASGKTEPKGAGLGPTADCSFLDPLKCSPRPVLTLTSSSLSPPLGQNPKVCKNPTSYSSLRQLGVLFNSSGFAFILRN